MFAVALGALMSGGAGAAGATPAGAGASQSRMPGRPPAGPVPTVDAFFLGKWFDAHVNGERQVTIVALSAAGRTAALEARIADLGGARVVSFDEIGYVRAILPTERFLTLAADPLVEALGIDWTLMIADNSLQATDLEAGVTTARAERVPRHIAHSSPEPATSFAPEILNAAGGYVPLDEIGVRRLRAEHPTFDGRGVTIGMVEGTTGFQFDHPLLQHGCDLQGRPTPKVAGIVDPRLAEPAGLFVERRGAERRSLGAHSRRVERIDERVFVAGDTQPAVGTLLGPPGRWSHGVYRLEDAGTAFAAIWDAATGHLIVDANRNHDLRDDPNIGDINRGGRVGILDTRDVQQNSVPGPDTIPIVAAFTSAGVPMIYEGTGGHFTMTASAAAGGSLPGGGAVSAAPCAQIIPVLSGTTFSRDIEARILALRDARIDLISSSGGGAPTPTLAANRAIREQILDRAMRLYDKPVANGAGNAGPTSHFGHFSSSSDLDLEVGGYVSRASTRALFDTALAQNSILYLNGRRTTRPDGSLMADVVAPVYGLAGFPCAPRGSDVPAWIPLCYGIGGGTSSAAPRAAGGLAALISGARQAGRHYGARTLLTAVRATAGELGGSEVGGRGYGLLDVNAAWQYLMTHRDAPPLFEIEAPALLPAASGPPTPFPGGGVVERLPWRQPEMRRIPITVTRRSGVAGLERFALRWRGDHDGLTGPTHVDLPLGQSRTIHIVADLANPGAYAALLSIERVDGALATSIPISIIAAPVIEVSPEAHVFLQQVQWPTYSTQWLYVPPGMASLELSVSSQGRTSVLVQRPPVSTEAAEVFPVRPRHVVDLQDYSEAEATRTIRIDRPTTGVYGIIAVSYCPPDARTGEGAACAPDRIESRYRADTEVVIEARVQPDVPAGGIGQGRVVDAEPHGVWGWEGSFDLPPGARKATIRLDRRADAHAELRLFDCTAGGCRMGPSFLPARAEISAPAAGRWRFLLICSSACSRDRPIFRLAVE